jgi:hypothetical protein
MLGLNDDPLGADLTGAGLEDTLKGEVPTAIEGSRVHEPPHVLVLRESAEQILVSRK